MSAGEAKPAGAGRTDASQGLAGASAPPQEPGRPGGRRGEPAPGGGMRL